MPATWRAPVLHARRRRWVSPRPRPSLAAAKKAFAEGQLDRADVEANALRALNIDSRGGDEVLDDLHLDRLKKKASFEGAVESFREGWSLDDHRQTALALLHEVGERRKDELYRAKDAVSLANLFKLVREIDPALANEFGGDAVLARAEQCVQEKNCACVAENLHVASNVEALAGEVARIRALAVPAFTAEIKTYLGAHTTLTSDPHDRQKALKSALTVAKCYPEVAGAPSDPAPPAIEAQLVPVDHDVEVADKKAAAEEARRRAQQDAEDARRRAREAAEEARQRAVQAAQEAQERAANRHLLCGDGWTSGCLCAGSHRGCCSHHGGVAGCEPL